MSQEGQVSHPYPHGAPLDDSNPSIPTGSEAAAPAMGGVVTSGMGWAVALTVISKLMSAATTLVLAVLLSPGDYGVYNASLAVSQFVLIFRDGGVRELLIQRGAGEYHRLIGPVFWMALTINSLTALGLAAAAPVFSGRYSHMPQMLGVLLITALSLPLATPGAVLMCRLRIDLRFRLVSNIGTASAFLRYATTILMAFLGFGPMSFVIPLLFIAAFESLVGWYFTRETPWLSPARPALWPGFLGQVKWLFLGAFAGAMLDQGDSFVAMGFLSADNLGYYGFANILLLQSVYATLSFATGAVLFPILTRLVSEPKRHAEAGMRFLRTLMLLASPACLVIAAVFEPFEKWLLGSKWDDSVLPLQILAVMFPIRCTIGLTTSMLLSQGRFKRWACLTIVEGAALIGATLFSASFFGTPTAIALSTAGTLLITRPLVVGHVMKLGGTPLRETTLAMLRPWALGVGAFLVAINIDHAMPPGLSYAVRIIVVGAAFSAAYAFAARLAASREIRDSLTVLPRRFRPLAERLLMLKHHAER